MMDFGSIQSVAIAFASIYIFITACRCSETRISVDLSHHVSHSENNVTLTCRVQGAPQETAVVWEKLPVTGKDEEGEIIGRDDQISDDYRKLTKYDIIVVELPNVILSILSINNVDVDDSGRIGCSISLEGTTFRDTTLFQVFKRPSDILCSCEQCTFNSEISATEGEALEVQCLIRGVQPLPHVSVHLGHHSLAGHHALTNWTTNVRCGQQQQQQLEWSSASGEGDLDVKHCPVHFDYDVQFRLTNYRVSYLDDGRELTIAVSLGQSGWPPTVKTLPVSVRYAPKFNCSKLIECELHSRNLVIACRLRSNPPLSNTPVVWWRCNHQSNRTLHVGQSVSGYELRQQEPTASVDGETMSLRGVEKGSTDAVAYTLELIIAETRTQDFHTAFHFSAENEVGSTTQTVRLRQITPLPPKPQTTIGRPHSHHTRRPSSRVQSTNGGIISTLHPILCAAIFICRMLPRFLKTATAVV